MDKMKIEKELDKNNINILHFGDNYYQITKHLRGKFEFEPKEDIPPPKLILISGSHLAGKSTLADFMKKYITASERHSLNENFI